MPFLSLPLAVALLSAPPSIGTDGGKRGGERPAPPPEEISTLTRVREGGTPYDPNQPLVPYALDLRTADADGGVAGAALGGLVESPAEYEPVRGVLFQYGNSWNSVVTACVSRLTAGSQRDEIAWVVVSSQSLASSAASAFAAAGANLSKVVFLIHPNNSVWMRDYGPHFVRQGGAIAILDSHYYPTRPLDNFVPTLVAESGFTCPAYPIGLYYSGGNFQAGPNRSGFVTALINLDNPASAGFNPGLIAELHDTFKGIDTLHVLPQLPTTVDGTGHIDMWMYLVDEDTAIVSEFLPGSNATAISVTNNAVPYLEALGFEVFRPKAWNASGAHYTYANAFRVNDRIFVPVYGTGIVPGGNSAYNARDTEAMAIWQQAAGPGVEIVPIQCASIIGASGAIHCIVKQVPRHVDLLPAAHVLAPAGGETWLVGDAETIRWNATDTDNAALASIDLAYSADGGATWTPIATGLPDTGRHPWTVPATPGRQALVRVTARSRDGDATVAVSNPFRIARGERTVFDFSTGAGVDRFGFGRQTASWASVAGNPNAAATPLVEANYAALAASDATGGSTDPNRYVSATLTSGWESTHVFRFVLGPAAADADEIRILWEGFANACTQVELYAWNAARNEWGDASGRIGQNRFLANWAGNRDERLLGVLRENLADYLDADGGLRVLVYAERPNDRAFHDYLAVSVIRATACAGDIDGNGSVDGVDLATVLGGWGPCPGGCAADLDGNGAIDGVDLAILLGNWGGCD